MIACSPQIPSRSWNFGDRVKNSQPKRHNPSKTWLVEEEGCGAIADLADDEQARLREMVERKLSPRVEGQLRATHLAMHHIAVQGHTHIKQRCRVVSPKVLEAMYQEVVRMLAEGVIKESFSNWSTPIVMAKKANGGYRLCQDFSRYFCSLSLLSRLLFQEGLLPLPPLPEFTG